MSQSIVPTLWDHGAVNAADWKSATTFTLTRYLGTTDRIRPSWMPSSGVAEVVRLRPKATSYIN
jgi:hypothetical protein